MPFLFQFDFAKGYNIGYIGTDALHKELPCVTGSYQTVEHGVRDSGTASDFAVAQTCYKIPLQLTYEYGKINVNL